MITNKKIFDSYTIILILFCLIEVLFFDDKEFQLFFSIFEYLFCSFLILTNLKKGIVYFLSFTLLSLGIGNFYGENLPNNFWGIRIGNFSFNILYSLFILIYTIVISNKPIKFLNFKYSFFYKFILILFFYGLFRGVVSIVFNELYLENFFNDLMTYFPFFIYFFLLSQLNDSDYECIFFSTFIASFFLLIFAYVFGRTFEYGNSSFLVQNTICNVILIVFFILRKKLNLKLFIVMLIVFLFFITKGLIFLSGKVIITILVYFVFLLLKNKSFRFIFIPTLFLFLFKFNDIINYLIDSFYGNVISFKLEQIKSLVNISSIEFISKSHNSVGNLVAEIRTSVEYFSDNIVLFVSGEGFGGGIPDSLNLLKPWTKLAGYAEIDGVRNNYYKMHLPITEMFVKGGMFLVVLYIVVLYLILKIKHEYKILFFFMFFLFFYISKENLLYTMLIYNILINKKLVK